MPSDHDRLKSRRVGIFHKSDIGFLFRPKFRRNDLAASTAFSDAALYAWRSKFGRTEVSDTERLKMMKQEG